MASARGAILTRGALAPVVCGPGENRENKVYQEQRIRFGPGTGMTPAVKLLLIVNGAVFFLQALAPEFFYSWFALRPYHVWRHFNVWQLVTYMFLHGGLMHIVFNMFALWMFGCQIERLFGQKRFYTFYLLTGIAAGLTHLIFLPNSLVPVIGASGATYGILLAFALYFPDTKLFIFPFVFTPIKAKYLVLIVGAIAFFGSVSALGGGGVAHLAHLGGMVFAYFYIRRLRFLNDVHYLVQRVRQRSLRKKYKVHEGGQGQDRTPGGFPRPPRGGDDDDFTVH
jgi:membrane associated rhomboid family serine protease